MQDIEGDLAIVDEAVKAGYVELEYDEDANQWATTIKAIEAEEKIAIGRYFDDLIKAVEYLATILKMD